MKILVSKYLVLLAVCGFCTFIAPRTTADLSSLPEHQPAPNIPNVYDTLATDLSDYIWPTIAGPRITSTFAEYRRTHFHGGIDIGTGTTTGFKVYASRDGFIERIRVSPDGYGKILYMRHGDGFVTTYAHLDRFSDDVELRVLQEQTRLERYPVSITCDPEEFPVNKGEVIAFTGETGAGSPHLHFEIRDVNDNFVNPFLADNVLVADHVAPTIRKISVTPIGESSTVNKQLSQQVFKAKAIKTNKFVVVDPIHISGEAGFAVSARDRSDGSWIRHGVYSHSLYIDGQLYYQVQLDRAPNREAHQIALYYEPDLLLDGFGRFERLYVDSPNSLPFYKPAGMRSGVVNSDDLSDGPHDFKILSRDIQGNESELSGTVIFNHPPVLDVGRDERCLIIPLAERENVERVHVSMKKFDAKGWQTTTYKKSRWAGSDTLSIQLASSHHDMVKVVAENQWGSTSVPFITFLRPVEGRKGVLRLITDIGRESVRLTAVTDRFFTEAPSAVIYEGDRRTTITFTPVDVDRYIASFSPDDSWSGLRRISLSAKISGHEASAVEEFELYPVVAGKSDSIVFDGGRLLLSYDNTTALKTFFAQISKSETDGEVSYSLSPSLTVLGGPIGVRMLHDASTQGQALYFANRFVKKMDSTGIAEAVMQYNLSDISVRRDTHPPRISNIRIRIHKSRRPLISWSYGDDISGVEYNELKMYIDDDFVVPEVDGEHNRVSYTSPEPLSKGPHLLTIRILDKMGNRSEEQRRFVVK